jgi:hypothetical protein
MGPNSTRPLDLRKRKPHRRELSIRSDSSQNEATEGGVSRTFFYATSTVISGRSAGRASHAGLSDCDPGRNRQTVGREPEFESDQDALDAALQAIEAEGAASLVVAKSNCDGTRNPTP